MTKFTRAQKLKMVKRVVFGRETLKSICDDTKIVKKDLQLLIAAFRGHGADVILNPIKPTPQLKLAIAKWIVENNPSQSETAFKFGYTVPTQMRRWRDEYLENGEDSKSFQENASYHPNQKSMVKKKRNDSTNEKIEKLEKEILHLKIENEALKYFARNK